MPSVIQPAMGLGDALMAQASAETDDERKKRLAQMQQQKIGVSPLSSMMGSTRQGALSSVYGGAY
jgi:hypothetical protein